jgi:hypothetical protein
VEQSSPEKSNFLSKVAFLKNQRDLDKTSRRLQSKKKAHSYAPQGRSRLALSKSAPSTEFSTMKDFNESTSEIEKIVMVKAREVKVGMGVAPQRTIKMGESVNLKSTKMNLSTIPLLPLSYSKEAPFLPIDIFDNREEYEGLGAHGNRAAKSRWFHPDGSWEWKACTVIGQDEATLKYDNTPISPFLPPSLIR